MPLESLCKDTSAWSSAGLIDRQRARVVVGQSLWAGVDAGKADHYRVVIDADEQRLELPLKSWRVLYVTGLPGVILA